MAKEKQKEKMVQVTMEEKGRREEKKPIAKAKTTTTKTTFQFLIGRLVTFPFRVRIGVCARFQFLIGRLVTYIGTYMLVNTSCFNSS